MIKDIFIPNKNKQSDMPIKSYLAHPHDGKKENLAEALNALESCEVIPAENKNLLIIVTDTDNLTEDEQLKETIEAIDSLKLLALVSGFDTPKTN
ncbi:MAG: hypothetical protein ABJL44_07730 [Algibacter sp.]